MAVPDAHALLNGSYSRAQDALVIELPDGTSYFISGYFSGDSPPALIAPNGIVVSAEVAAQLAGPSHPGQYAQASGANGAKPIGQVVSVDGTVTVQRADGTVVTLSSRDFVFVDDVIVTAANSSVAITFTDDSVLRLSADARMILDQYVYSPQEQTGNTAVFNLLSGAVGAVSGLIAPSGNMLVNTPSATLAIRGTSVLIEATANETRVNILVDIKDGQGGLVEIVNPANPQEIYQSVTVNNIGQVVSVIGGSGTITVSQLSAADQAALTSVVSVLTGSYSASQESSLEINAPPTDNADDAGDNDAGEGGTEGQGQEQQPDGQQEGAPGDAAPEQGGEEDSGELNNQGQEIQIALDDGSGEQGGDVTSGAGDVGSTAPPAVQSPLTGGAGGTQSGSGGNTPPPVTTPQITLPSAPTINEDASGIALNGFNVSTGGTAPVTVSLSAFSTITITNTTGLTLVSGSFTDAENVVFTGSPQNVTNALNSILYTPTADNDQTGGFAISVSDGTSVQTATLTVPLTGQPDAPVVNAGISGQTAVEETAFSFTVPGNAFRDPDSGDTLSLTATLPGGSPLPAWLNFDGTTFTGTPDDPDVGTITVEVTASDTQAGTADVSTTFTLQVTPVNDAAVITGDVSGSMLEDDEGTSGNLDHTDADNADDVWVATSVNGSFGTLTIDAGGVWEYSPTTNFDSLSDGETLTDTITVATEDGTDQDITITITGENDAAVITGDVSGTAFEDGANATGDLDYTDVDGPGADDAWSTSVVTQGQYGTLSITNAGAWTYVVDNGNVDVDQLGNLGGTDVDTLLDTVTVATVDGTTQDIQITITGYDDPPIFSGDISGVLSGTAEDVSGNVDYTDPDNEDDDWSETVVAQGALGVASITNDGAWVYEANVVERQALGAGETAVDSFTVGTPDGPTQDIEITIVGDNDAAQVSGDTTGEADEDSVIDATGDLNSTDVDNNDADDAWSTSVVTQGQYGTLSITAAGVWAYVVDNANPAVDALANDGFTFVDTLIDTVTVATEDGTEQDITITITGENDAAVITGDVSGSMLEDDEGTSGNLDHTDADNADDVWVATSVNGSFGTLTIDAGGVWEYSPTTNFDSLSDGETLTDTITVATEDGTEQDITITITGENDAAVITGDVSGSMLEDDEGTSGNLDHTDADNADDVWVATSVNGSFGTLTIDAGGVWEYSPTTNFDSLSDGETLTDTITVATEDGTTQDITITITGENDAAVITGNVSGSMLEDDEGTSGNLDHTDADNADDVWVRQASTARSARSRSMQAGYGSTHLPRTSIEPQMTSALPYPNDT